MLACCDGVGNSLSDATNSLSNQVRLDSSGNSFSLIDIGPSHSAAFNSIGFNRNDKYIYGLNPGVGEVWQIASDGAFQSLGVPTNFPTSPSPFSYYVGDVDKNQVLWVHAPGVNQVRVESLDAPGRRAHRVRRLFS